MLIFLNECDNILWQSELMPISSEYALLAQLDRVFGYEPKGQGFESLAARHTETPCISRSFGFFMSFTKSLKNTVFLTKF